MILTSVIIVAGIFAIACTSAPADTVAHGKTNLMIVGVDYDENTLERDNRISRRVLDAISNELHIEGFNVFDETAVTLENYAQRRTRRSDSEIIDIGSIPGSANSFGSVSSWSITSAFPTESNSMAFCTARCRLAT